MSQHVSEMKLCNFINFTTRVASFIVAQCQQRERLYLPWRGTQLGSEKEICAKLICRSKPADHGILDGNFS